MSKMIKVSDETHEALSKRKVETNEDSLDGVIRAMLGGGKPEVNREQEKGISLQDIMMRMNTIEKKIDSLHREEVARSPERPEGEKYVELHVAGQATPERIPLGEGVKARNVLEASMIGNVDMLIRKHDPRLDWSECRLCEATGLNVFDGVCRACGKPQ